LINGDSSPSSTSMSSEEDVSARVLAFSFTLHSCFVGNIVQIVLKCSFLSFSTASSLNFCALIHRILLLWMGVSPRGHQRGAGAVSGTVVLDVLFCLDPREIGWSGLPNQTNRFGCCCEQATALVLISVSLPGALFCFSATSLDLSPCYTSVHHRLKSCSSALSDLDCPSPISRRYGFRHPLVVLLTRGCSCLWGNRMV
jgi:hypothetical protein